MARLCLAQFLVLFIPFDRWRNGLGAAGGTAAPGDSLEIARRLAADVEWAAQRLPFPTKCLPRAMALSWMLRRRRIGHTLVIAVRPSPLRHSPDALHAWVEAVGQKVLGDLPGPWVETARLGS
jgi:hypothetical protein